MADTDIPSPAPSINPSESPPWQYFMATFGTGHPLGKHVVGIRARDSAVARDAMFRTFGEKWCSIYPWHDPKSGFARQSADFGVAIIFCVSAVFYPHGNYVTACWLEQERFLHGVANQLVGAA